MLTSTEILMLLNALHPGGGYSEDARVERLQGKLSIMLEAARRKEIYP